ncbi:MAG: hypothetical protein J7M13_04630, partial [Synergistetes bacterium]|nr:hypothetical protein [Synergistota bacterium]
AGLFIIATITSLPEFATAISGVLEGYPNMVIGDILGSNFFNITAFSLFSFVWFNLLKKSEDSGAYKLIGWGLLFTSFTMFGILFKVNLFPVFLVYPLIVISMFKRSEGEAGSKSSSGGNAILIYLFGSGTLVAVAGYFLIVSAGKLATLTSLTNTFMGTLFIAVVTSLPEVSTSCAALRRGSYNLFVGDLLGSNLFNFFILPIAAFLYKGSMISEASLTHLITCLGVMIVSSGVLLLISHKWRALGLALPLVYPLFIFMVNKGVEGFA